MPELPEVETIRRALEPRVEGDVLERLEVLDPRFSAPAPPEELEEAASGRRIASLTRRGIGLSGPSEEQVARHAEMHDEVERLGRGLRRGTVRCGAARIVGQEREPPDEVLAAAR